MSANLADFGHDYRSVNLQCPSTYLLVRNGNPFDSQVAAQMFLGSRQCSAWLPHGLVWSSVLSTRPSISGMDSCAPVWELMDNTSNICSEPRTSFGLILLFNFANMHFMIGTLSNCCFLYNVQLQHVKPGVVGWVMLNFRYKILLTCVC